MPWPRPPRRCRPSSSAQSLAKPLRTDLLTAGRKMETICPFSVIASQCSCLAGAGGRIQRRHGMTDRFATAEATGAIRLWWPSTIVGFAALATLWALTGAPPADAAARQARPAQSAEATAPREAGEPIMAVVSIKSQKVTFYDAEGW